MKRYAFSLLLFFLTVVRANSDPPVVVRPNADAVLDVAAAGQNEGGETIANPFRVRYRPQLRIREVPLVVSSVLVGPDAMNASVIVNGEIYGPGDAWEGLSVGSITAETIELRLGKIILQVPVGDRPLTVRLPR